MPACKTNWVMSASAAAACLVLAMAGTANAGGAAARNAAAYDNCGCAPGGPYYNFPPPNIAVQVLGVANANASAQSVSGAQAAARAETTGVGGAWVEQGSAPSLIQGLDVETDEAQVRRVDYQATRRVERRVLIEAVCLDDKATPHPASQVHPERDVADSYDGEIFRCIAGTRLQATIGDYNDALTLARGETLSCDKMQALYHAPGGAVACRTQTPARDCNERSLLRRYGPGVKVLKLVREETYTAERDETLAPQTKAGGMLTLDGGVGGYH